MDPRNAQRKKKKKRKKKKERAWKGDSKDEGI